jgi:hypothetical protein
MRAFSSIVAGTTLLLLTATPLLAGPPQKDTLPQLCKGQPPCTEVILNGRKTKCPPGLTKEPKGPASRAVPTQPAPAPTAAPAPAPTAPPTSVPGPTPPMNTSPMTAATGTTTNIVAKTFPVSGVSVLAATLNGHVSFQGKSGRAWFEWGETQNFGQATPAQMVTADKTISAAVRTGDQRVKGYYYRIVAESGGNLVRGEINQFGKQ